jgi:hypothetical protein
MKVTPTTSRRAAIAASSIRGRRRAGGIMVIGPAIGQPRIGVEIEDDRLIGSEQRIELVVGETVWMFGAGHQPKQIDDIDEAQLQLRKMLALQRSGG